METSKPLILYLDDSGEQRTTYSNYKIVGDVIIFETNKNKITIPTARLIKIKEAKNENS